MESPKKRVWITGGRGLIGNYLAETAWMWAPGFAVNALTRAEVDLCDFSEVKKLFSQFKPDAVIHCAALSKSPACQANPILARKLNVEVTRMLADLCSEVPFLFFSTDLVFDGKKGDYTEEDPVNPVSIYAETKVEAERVVLANPKHTVVRTSLNGGVSLSGDRGFNEEIRMAWRMGRTLDLFVDEFRCPIPAEVTARAVWELIHANRPGLYHLAGREKLSRFDIGMLLADRWPDLNPRIDAGTLKAYHGAPRSPDTSLNCAKLQKIIKFQLPGLRQWLMEHPKSVF
jgi:dTDP-4-dehydrorhamnose reductase